MIFSSCSRILKIDVQRKERVRVIVSDSRREAVHLIQPNVTVEVGLTHTME